MEVVTEMLMGMEDLAHVRLQHRQLNHHGGFVVSPDSVWYAQVLLLFSASAATDTGSKSFFCALVSTMETYDDPENSDYYLH
jgi:hypothetical protein